MGSAREQIIALLLTAAMFFGAVAPAAAAQPDHRGADRRYSAGTYVTTGLSNVLYIPAKVVFAGAGAVTSGVAYVVSLGNERVARNIWDRSTGGDYVVTAPMVAGERPVRFVG